MSVFTPTPTQSNLPKCNVFIDGTQFYAPPAVNIEKYSWLISGIPIMVGVFNLTIIMLIIFITAYRKVGWTNLTVLALVFIVLTVLFQSIHMVKYTHAASVKDTELDKQCVYNPLLSTTVVIPEEKEEKSFTDVITETHVHTLHPETQTPIPTPIQTTTFASITPTQTTTPFNL
jgi:hypothetical protein